MSVSHLVPDFSRLRVAVVGDLVADHYLFGEPTRLSREAPVMVLRHRGEELGAGGAANAARNLRSLGAHTRVLGVVARDRNGRALLELLERDGIDVSGVLTQADWVTPTKTRIVGAERGRTRHQMLRIDREPEAPAEAGLRAALGRRLAELGGELDAVLFSDYGYGLLDGELGRVARELCARGVRVVLDPRHSFELFHGITAITPNLGELALATGRSVAELAAPAELERAAHEVLERCAPAQLLVTLGNRGMALFEAGRAPATVRAAGSEAVDVSGAGDTAAAAFTLALAAGGEGAEAMRLANAAAGIVVMEPGAAACPIDKLRSQLPAAPLAEGLQPVRA